MATGKTLVTLFGFPLSVGLIVGVAVILFYTFVGGYFAVAWTDVIQGFIMIGSLIIVFVATMMKMGWFTGLNEALAAIDPTLLSVWGRGNVYEGGYGVIAGAVGIYLIGYMGLPHSVNKHMAMGSPQTAKTSVVYATIWTQLFCFIPYFLGLAGLVIFTANPAGLIDNDPELVIPSLTALEFPGVFSGPVSYTHLHCLRPTGFTIRLCLALSFQDTVEAIS